MNYLAWLLLSALCFGGGEVYAKRLALAPSVTTGALMVGWYLLGTLAWIPAIIQRKDLIVAGTIWSVLTLLITVGIGLWFGETMTWRLGAGVACAILAVVLLAG